MKLRDKLEIAKRAVESITRHDDEPLEYREIEIAKLLAHIGDEMDAAKERAALKAKG